MRRRSTRVNHTTIRVRTQVLHTIRAHALIPPGSHILAAVSGGADSLCLLHVLADLRGKLGFSLSAATFDHRLRGEASAADAAFVIVTADSLGIPVTAGQAAELTPDPAEAASRRARYEFLMNVCATVGADRIALGHHSDDQAETVLLRLVRGTGTSGLAGMAYHAPGPTPPHYPVIRPLLDVRRADTEAYCAAVGIVPRQDHTNDDPAYLRNRIRADLLPLLRALNPQIDRLLAQTAAIAAADDAFLDTALTAAIRTIEQTTPTAIGLPRRAFRRLDEALRRRWIASASSRLLVEAESGISFAHIIAADALASHGGTGQIALLGLGLRLRLLPEMVMIEHMPTSANDEAAGNG